jgi:hypothetical protein
VVLVLVVALGLLIKVLLVVMVLMALHLAVVAAQVVLVQMVLLDNQEMVVQVSHRQLLVLA